MSEKTAYLWGPVSNFSAYLIAWLLENGWRVDLPSKSAWHISLSPLDLQSSAQSAIEKALGCRDKFKALSSKIRLLDGNEIPKDTTYDTVLFCALPSNFDEPRVSRAIWAANELQALSKRLKGIPTIVFSSLWGAIQNDGVVPEEIEFGRRKSRSQFEAVCQQYELKMLNGLSKQESPWYWVRLPMLCGSTIDGSCTFFSGLSGLLESMLNTHEKSEPGNDRLVLNYNPDASFWMLPVNIAAELAGRMIEDDSRPRICNLVSTQSVLNQEWLQTLARIIGFSGIETGEKDGLSLSSTLRGMLTDNIQVKTRNLFEVMGRHHQSPRTLDQDYFEKLLAYGKKENWGHLRPASPSANSFREEIARDYFMHFLPSKIDEKSGKLLNDLNEGLFVSIADKEGLSWQLLPENGGITVRHSDPEKDGASLRIILKSSAFESLVKGKLSLEQALVTKEVQLKGSLLNIFKAFSFFNHFLKKQAYTDDWKNESNTTSGQELQTSSKK